MVLISAHEMLATRNVSRDSHRILDVSNLDVCIIWWSWIRNFSQFKFCIT